MSTSSQVYKLSFCPYKRCEISAVGARQCNYSNLENYTCRHTGELCVASEGLEAFAQSLAESALPIVLTPEVFQQMKEKVEDEKRQKMYREIAKMAEHICGPKDKK